jgi:hypothetical protein
MFSLSFDGHGSFVAPHLDALNTTVASVAALGNYGVWNADFSRDATSMAGRFQAFANRPATKRIVYIEGASSSTMLVRVDVDGRVLFGEAELRAAESNPSTRAWVDARIKPDGHTAWFGDWQFMQSVPLKTSLGAPMPTASSVGLSPFLHPLTGAVITDEAEFWLTRSALALIGVDDHIRQSYAAIPADLATSMGLSSVSTQRADGQWQTSRPHLSERNPTTT